MKPISSVSTSVPVNPAQVMSDYARELKQQGRPVLSFCVGEPDFQTPSAISAAGIRAIQDGCTKYSTAAGFLPLREAISEKLRSQRGVAIPAEQIVITGGAKLAVYAALQALLNPGDEVLLPVPCWPSYMQQIRLAGGVPVLVPTDEKENFSVTVEALKRCVSPRSKLMILNQPCNPTGKVYSREELEKLCRFCREQDLYILSDEIYSGLVYTEQPFVSPAAIDEDAQNRTIVVGGASKSFAMTGWRVGYAAGNESIASVMASCLSNMAGCASTVSQMAALEAYTASYDEAERFCKAFRARRDAMLHLLDEVDGIRVIRPEGAFYLFIDIRPFIGRVSDGAALSDDVAFCRRLLEKQYVALTPGSAFCRPGFVRWSFAADMDCLKLGVDRFRRFLDSLETGERV